MIRTIHGNVVGSTDHGILLSVGPVDFDIVCAHSEGLRLIERDEDGPVWVQLEVEENALTLVGFSSELALNIYRALRRIGGVGRVTALAALESGDPIDTLRAVAMRDKAFLTSLPDIGPKRAMTLIEEVAKVYGGGLPRPLPISVLDWVHGRERLMSQGMSFEQAERRLWDELA